MSSQFARVKVNEQGRVVLPAALRCVLNIRPGDTVAIVLKDDHLEVFTNEALLERLSAIGDGWTGPSVVDELIADRRAEAAREMAE